MEQRNIASGVVCVRCDGCGKVKNPKYSLWEIYTGAYLPWTKASDSRRGGTWEEQEEWDIEVGAPQRRLDCRSCKGTGFVEPKSRNEQTEQEPVGRNRTQFCVRGLASETNLWVLLRDHFDCRREASQWLKGNYRRFVQRHRIRIFCIEESSSKSGPKTMITADGEGYLNFEWDSNQEAICVGG